MEAIAGFFGLTLLLIILALSFIPVIIAAVRKHNDTILIFLLTFFLGWTVIGWIVALIWSLSSNVQGVARHNQPVDQSLTVKLNELTSLLNKKLITQEEHDAQKKKILESN
jgi:uncharacterized oligopeptide transporter (OPT) family protein